MKKGIVQRVALILLMAAALPAAALENRPVRIEWEEVKGARGYILEIKNREGREIYRKKIADSFALVDIAPGDYKIRITALNVFMKPGSNSGWTAFMVKKKARPQEKTEEESLTIGKLGDDKERGEKEKKAALEEERRKEEERLKEAERLKELERQKEADRKKEEERLREAERSKKEEESKKAVRVPRDFSRGMAGLGPLDIGGGASYQFILTGWERYLNSAPGAQIAMSYRLSGIPAVQNIRVLRNFGLAVKFDASIFTGRNKDRARMKITSFSLGAGIFYDFNLGTVQKWAFDLRLACLVGPSFTSLETGGLFPDKKEATSLYYDPRVSFRFLYNGYFFLELGCGFHSVELTGQPLSSIYPFLQTGIRL